MVVPAPGVPLPVQVDPSTIADPVKRQEYEAAIAANEKKKTYTNQQFRLRQWLYEIRVTTLFFIADSYRKAYRDDTDLIRVANEIGVNQPFQKEMTDTFQFGEKAHL